MKIYATIIMRLLSNWKSSSNCMRTRKLCSRIATTSHVGVKHSYTKCIQDLRNQAEKEHWRVAIYLPTEGNIFPFGTRKRSLAITQDSNILSLTNKVPTRQVPEKFKKNINLDLLSTSTRYIICQFIQSWKHSSSFC